MEAVAQQQENTSCAVQATLEGQEQPVGAGINAKCSQSIDASCVKSGTSPDRLSRSHHFRQPSRELLTYFADEDLNDDHDVTVPRPIRKELEIWKLLCNQRRNQQLSTSAPCEGIRSREPSLLFSNFGHGDWLIGLCFLQWAVARFGREQAAGHVGDTAFASLWRLIIPIFHVLLSVSRFI